MTDSLSTFTVLLETPDVKKLRQIFLNMSPRVRQGFFNRYFCPVLSAPRAAPVWLETDTSTYSAQLREDAYGITENNL